RPRRPHILHTHTAKAGAVARAAALLAGNARPPVVLHTFHGHVLKGYFDAGRTAFFRQVERTLARASDVLVAVSPEVRDELVGLGVAPREELAVIRLGIPPEARLVGGGPDRERLEQHAHDLGIARSSFFVGYQPDVAGFYRLFDAFLLPSVNAGTHVSAIEALAVGADVA